MKRKLIKWKDGTVSIVADVVLDAAFYLLRGRSNSQVESVETIEPRLKDGKLVWPNIFFQSVNYQH